MIIFCVFAHPDDEAFGPGGTIAKYAKNNDVYLICATRGEQGQNHDENSQNEVITTIREKELIKSAELLGIKKIFFLDYEDGTLNNNQYHEIAKKITGIITPFKPEILLTFEPRGISGHLDHVAMSLITSYVFRENAFCKKLYYHALNKNYSTRLDDYFVYFPEGYDPKEITTTIDITSVWDTKVKSMLAHKSQQKDAKNILAKTENYPKNEYFILGENRLSQLKLPETDLLNGLEK